MVAEYANLGDMSIKLVFYGPPGAGKDTQTERLSEILGIPHFSVGQMMREEVAKNTLLGQEIKSYVEAGTMPPGGVATRVFRELLPTPKLQASGYIVNGYPRSVESLQTYLNYDRPTAVIHLVIPDEIARVRLSARGRHDDTPEIIDTRIQRYHEIEEAAVHYVRDQTDVSLIEIDGTLPVEEITKTILERLKV